MAIDLTPAHHAILEATGHLLVVGGPGSGKTTVALLKAQERLGRGVDPGQEVLFLSFSRAAVARVLEASRTALPKAVRDCIRIQTFHSFFWDLVRTHGYLLGSPKRLQLLLPHDEQVRKNALGKDWPAEAERLFREEGLTTFDLFAPKAVALLRGSVTLRKLIASRYPMIVVDEAQDTSRCQWDAMQTLASDSELVCLADMEQQIYDWNPDVSPERLDEIVAALHPTRVDLEASNHRSPDQEIVTFGNDVLLGKPRGAAYKGVGQLHLPPQAAERDRKIRQSVGILRSKVLDITGQAPQSLAILATWNKGVAMVARALEGDGKAPPIPHMVLMDEGRVVLASRVVAFILDGEMGLSDTEATQRALVLVAHMFRSSEGVGATKQAKSLELQIAALRQGKQPRANACSYGLREVLRARRTLTLSGIPEADWLTARRLLEHSPSAALQQVGKQAAHLATLGLRRRIGGGLLELWQDSGTYRGAGRVLEAAVSEEHLLGGTREMRGTSVMTIHKAKGREFDGVIIVHDNNSSPFMVLREGSPYPRSRRLLRVAVTRAKHQVLLLMSPLAPRPPMLDGHKL